jgi:hypothetical protein
VRIKESTGQHRYKSARQQDTKTGRLVPREYDATNIGKAVAISMARLMLSFISV